MMRWLPILPVLLGFAVSAKAEELDKAKLRAAAYLPRMNMQFSFAVNLIGRDGSKERPELKIEQCKKQLANSKADGKTLLELAMLYRSEKRKSDACETLARAINLLQPITKSEGANDAYLIGVYARCLQLQDPSAAEVAIKWARRAVELAPNDWR